MNLEKITVRGLFGSLKHEIALSAGGITFVHGPNGCGKTTILRMLSALFGGDVRMLHQIDFLELEIEFSDRSILLVSRSGDKDRSRSVEFEFEEDFASAVSDISIELRRGRRKLGRWEMSSNDTERSGSLSRFSLSSISRRVPFLERVGPEQWMHRKSGELLDLDAVVERYGEAFNVSDRNRLPGWLDERLSGTRIGFIRTQRLIRVQPTAASPRANIGKSPRDVVEIYSNEIKGTIAKKLAESAVQSQVRDRSFPFRLLTKEFVQNVGQADFLEEYRATEQRAQNLMLAGLLDQAENVPLPRRKLTRFERDVLSLYLADFNDKLQAFDELQRRIEGLVEIVGKKLKRKRFMIDRNHGFVFETTDDLPRRLSVTDLSSGEQHQLVLFYELIFGSEGINLFLIDEPEISLHVEWQRAFLKDLEKVRELTGASFLVATHSPQIINNRRDIAVPLDGGL